MKVVVFYANNGIVMMSQSTGLLFCDKGYFLANRALTHGLFWLGYYVSFSLIWAKPETGLFASFYLEFLLLPARILCAYCVMYVLIPKYLLTRKFFEFVGGYSAVLIATALVQTLVGLFFYQGLLLQHPIELPSFAQALKNLLLVNTTVVFLSALSILKRYFALQNQLDLSTSKKLEIVAQRRTFIVVPDTIMYVQGLGNYVEIYLEDGRKLTTYSSIKAFQQKLPDHFIRAHKSYIVNRKYIDSFNGQDIVINGVSVPRGNECADKWLLAS